MLIYLRILGSLDLKLQYEADPTQTVNTIKTFVNSKLPNFQVNRFLFAGKILELNNAIESYEINKECIIQVMGNNKDDNKDNQEVLVSDEPNNIKHDKVDEKKVNNDIASSDELPAIANDPSLLRQNTDPLLIYGDIVYVEVVDARNLKRCDRWNNSSDPYCILVCGSNTARTRIIKKNINPVWNERFAFIVEGPAYNEILSILLWDHDYLSPDDPLGHIDIPVNNIPRNKPIDKTFKLRDISTGEVHLKLIRAPLTSPELRNKLLSMMKIEKNWSDIVLNKYKISIDELLGVVPYIHTQQENKLNVDTNKSKSWFSRKKTPSISTNKTDNTNNPFANDIVHIDGEDVDDNYNITISSKSALKHIKKLFETRLLHLNNNKSIAKIANILYTQQAIINNDIPTRTLAIMNITVKISEFIKLIEAIAVGGVKQLLVIPNPNINVLDKNFTINTTNTGTNSVSISNLVSPKSPLSPTASSQITHTNSLLITFRTCEIAIYTLLMLQGRTLNHTILQVTFANWFDNITDINSYFANNIVTNNNNTNINNNININNNNPYNSNSNSKTDNSSDEKKEISTSNNNNHTNNNPANDQNNITLNINIVPDHSAIDINNTTNDNPVIHRASVSLTAEISNNKENKENSVNENPISVINNNNNNIHPFLNSLFSLLVYVSGAIDTHATIADKLKLQSNTHLHTDWSGGLLCVNSTNISFYNKYSNKEALFNFNINDILILSIGSWSIELVNNKLNLSYFIRVNNGFNAELDKLKKLIKLLKNNNEDSNRLALLHIQALLYNKLVTIFKCNECKLNKPLAEFYFIDAADARIVQPNCRTCLHNRVKKLLDEKANLLAHYSLQDLKDLGSASEFESFLDNAAREFLTNQSSKIVTCPRCLSVFEIEYHSWSSRSYQLLDSLGLDNRPLNASAQQHFITNRFKCRNDKCDAEWCRSCNIQPYHIGFDCKQYIEFQNSPKCRYCGVAVMKGRNQLRSIIFKDICDSEECIKKFQTACTKCHKDCKHHCSGIKDENYCLPCLLVECVEKREETEQQAKEQKEKGFNDDNNINSVGDEKKDEIKELKIDDIDQNKIIPTAPNLINENDNKDMSNRIVLGVVNKGVMRGTKVVLNSNEFNDFSYDKNGLGDFAGLETCRLCELRIWSDYNYIYGLQCVWEVNEDIIEGNKNVANDCKLQPQSIKLAVDEWITNLEGRASTFIYKLTFTTNTGKTHSFGGNSGSAWNMSFPKQTTKIIGFEGSYNNLYLYQINCGYINSKAFQIEPSIKPTGLVKYARFKLHNDSNEGLKRVIESENCKYDEKKTNYTQTSEDLCNICYTEELGCAPIIGLECAHLFHYHCLEARIKNKWNGTRINFKFLCCPLCSVEMKHPALEKKIEPYIKLREQVIERVKIRMEVDKLAEDPHCTTEGSPYYKDPILYGMHVYAFFRCNHCSKPYFGGRRECEANGEAEAGNEEEQVCLDCSSVAMKDCGKSEHREFIQYKCRFCCSPAVWFCFGTTHFCDYCHTYWPPNRHPKNAICPPPGSKVCPLGLKVGSHSNGPGAECEYPLFCGMCRQGKRKDSPNF